MKRFGCLAALALVVGLLIGGDALSEDRALGNRQRENSAGLTREQIEASWLHEDQMRTLPASAKRGNQVELAEDAAGGVDGVKNGQWGFHTEHEEKPWWQVDLGKPAALDRVVLYNRCDAMAPRTARIVVLLSNDGKSWKQVYQHDGTTFYGFPDKKPATLPMHGAAARYVRLQLPGKSYFHLDEVEVYAARENRNIALGQPAMQSSLSRWSVQHEQAEAPKTVYRPEQGVQRGRRLAESLRRLGANVEADAKSLDEVARRLKQLAPDAPNAAQRPLYLEARWAVRRMALANPLLDFDTILFSKRAPGSLPHIVDQFYGWWSRPGGGVYLLKDFKTDRARLVCLTEGWPEGTFLRPELSYDAKKILFAYARHYAHVSAMEKVDKEKLPEDAFYHVFEMNLDGTGVTQLTRGRYDDFEARYLPNGEIVFLSTRKGTFVQVTKANTAATCEATLPDSYVRCGGDNTRPCAVFTLHKMQADGSRIEPISAFENFEWYPTVAHDGRILYARWDYIDRFNGHFMSLWSTNPDGTNAQLVYGNYTANPQCIFEARPIPGSHKLIFTATPHHSHTGGSLVILDRNRGTEFDQPLTRITPEVIFPEAEGWPESYYAGPYPLSEEFFLTAWSDRRFAPHAGSRQITDERNPVNPTGLYLYDVFGNLEPVYRDPELASWDPIPVRPRPTPPVYASTLADNAPQEGQFLLRDVYRGLTGVERGTVKSIRVVGMPPKTQPHMNTPVLGVSREDPGKFVLGTVPVEEDGSAHFRVPSGVSVFFQALDAQGMAVQTMRSLTYVQPGQTLACIGCHESRDLAPPARSVPLAALREPSKPAIGPEGSWPLRFDRLVQPVLDRSCVSCHNPAGADAVAARLDLTPEKAYESLIGFGQEDLKGLAFERDRSVPNDCPARKSKLLAVLHDGTAHKDVRLDGESLDRLVTWMDVYAQRLGSFSDEQERQLVEFRRQWMGE